MRPINFWCLFLIMPLGALLGYMGGGVYVFTKPRNFMSETILEIKTGDASTPSAPVDPQRRLTTEVALIKSQANLEAVARSLDLSKRWGLDSQTTLQKLESAIETSEIPGTDLVKMTVWHPDKNDAVEIAHSLAEVLRSRRENEQKEALTESIRELNEAVRVQEELVREKRERLMSLAREKQIDPFAERTQTTDAQNLEQAIQQSLDRQDVMDVKRELETEEQLHQQLKMKRIEQTVMAKIPTDSIEIHQSATVSPTAVVRKDPRLLVKGAAVGTLLSLPLGLLLLLVRSRKPYRHAFHDADPNESA